MAELLLEILSEEIPARMQKRAAEDIKRLVTDGLKDAGLAFDTAEVFVTPRRLAVVVDGLPEKQPDVSEERRGPRADAPEKAMAGFKGSLPEGAIIEERETEKGTFLFAKVDIKGGATADVLGGFLAKALGDLPWPKSMRWADNELRWVRPIHSMIAVFDGAAVGFALGPVQAGNATVGHRFLAPKPFAVSGFADYKEKLFAAKVMLDPAERRAKIKADAEARAAAAGLTVKDDPALLDEVTGLVEWPVVYLGAIDDAFMVLPPEVLTTSMRSHQKYFSCLDTDGKLANRFVMVANTETADHGAAVVAGNERVLRARLADAKFFWDQDRKTSLASKTSQLKERVFHAKLGSVFDKISRVMNLSSDLVDFPFRQAFQFSIENEVEIRNAAVKAAELCKSDLPSGMVGEFPELQGIMGRYYALHDGESEEVADAVAEHYSPVGPNDVCPSKPVSVAVAIADKVDSLAGFWSIDEKPTGSKDPFALRRAALGVIRLILENNLRIALDRLFDSALFGHGHETGTENLRADLLAFFADRLKVHLREQGVRHDHIDAVFALGDEDDLVRLMARVSALSDFLASEDGGNLLTAYKRAANILRIEEKKDGRAYDGAADDGAFEQDEERQLAAGLAAAGPAIEQALATEDFAGAMAALAKLRGPVDAFFDAVTVNADDAGLRENRLKLLNGIRGALQGVADFSKIEG